MTTLSLSLITTLILTLIKFQIYKQNDKSEEGLKQNTRLLKNKPPIITPAELIK